jgi:hypothetical protein
LDDVQGGADGVADRQGIGDRRQLHDPHPRPMPGGAASGQLERQAGLAAAGAAHQRHQPELAEHRLELGHLVPSPDAPRELEGNAPDPHPAICRTIGSRLPLLTSS